MEFNNELSAFDAIAVEVNVNRKKILFAQYSYKTKQYIIKRLNSEAERLEKENEKMSNYLGNIRQRITFSQSNLKSLHGAVLSIESINCTLKGILIQTQLNKLKLKQSFEVNLKKYNEKWMEDKKVYESTPLAKEKLRLMKEVENKKFQCRKLKLDKMNLAESFKRWTKIVKKQSQNTIIQFAVHITMWPDKMEELATRKEHIHQLIIQVNGLTQHKIAILAELDEMRINRSLCRINKKQITSKHIKFDSSSLDFDEGLPNLVKFCEDFKSEMLLLQDARKGEEKPEQKYEYMSIYSNKPYDLKEKDKYVLLQTDTTTEPDVSNKINENTEFNEGCASQIIEQSKQNKTINILQDIMLKTNINTLKFEAHSSLNQTNKFTQIKDPINYSKNVNNITVMSSVGRLAAIPQDVSLEEEYIKDKSNDIQSAEPTMANQCEEQYQCKVTLNQNTLENMSQSNVTYFTRAVDENNDEKYKLLKKYQLQQSPDYNFSNPQCSSLDNDVQETSKFFSCTLASNNVTQVSETSEKNEDIIGHGHDENVMKSTSNSNKHNEIENIAPLTDENYCSILDSNATDNVPMFGSDLPRSLSLNLQLDESHVVSEDDTLGSSNYLETPTSLLLSPKGGDEISLDSNDTQQLTGSNFLFGEDKTKRGSFKMFGEENFQNDNGDAFAFSFNSPEAKKKKNSFFNLFG